MRPEICERANYLTGGIVGRRCTEIQGLPAVEGHTSMLLE